MTTSYVAMLRGINVGGHARVAMTDLRATFADMGYPDARTYIQSGNVLFAASGSPTKLRATIEQGLQERFGGGTSVVLRTGAQLNDIIEHNPLLSADRDPKTLHVTFLASKPDSTRVRGLDTEAFLPDEFRVVGSEVFVHCPHGYGRTKLNNAFFERALGTVATTRTWNTVITLAGMAP
jgi:uncharacterized protein (DUF1697 family)